MENYIQQQDLPRAAEPKAKTTETAKRKDEGHELVQENMNK